MKLQRSSIAADEGAILESIQPKKLFSEGAPPPGLTGNTDVDDMIIRKQEKTFEEMLESQLKKAFRPGLGSDAAAAATMAASTDGPPVEVVVGMVATAAEQQQPVTPVKGDGASTQKKAFLRRGSSQKYDPQQARKQSQGSTKKFKYYSDNFQKRGKGQVAAAPKGTSGIPSLSIAKQPSNQAQQDDQKFDKQTPTTRQQ